MNDNITRDIRFAGNDRDRSFIVIFTLFEKKRR